EQVLVVITAYPVVGKGGHERSVPRGDVPQGAGDRCVSLPPATRNRTDDTGIEGVGGSPDRLRPPGQADRNRDHGTRAGQSHSAESCALASGPTAAETPGPRSSPGCLSGRAP